jgi:hypothetical protein
VKPFSTIHHTSTEWLAPGYGQGVTALPDNGGSQQFWWLWRPHPEVSQKEADRQAGQALASLLDGPGRREVEAPVTRGDRIRAIRNIRELTGLRLLDSRRIYDSLRR